MSEPANRAVFLSYASQDAEAVRSIAEALRTAGVEVWFDQNELTGGDAWDQKIRGQIKACALFVPVISVATQARGEGYFRIEWRLAAQRTHAMADDETFLLPVVIDETRDADARVPAEFKAVQWTRLRPMGYGGQARADSTGSGGQALDDAGVAAFCARVKQLLGGEAAEGRDASPRRPLSDSGESHGRLGETSLPRTKTNRPWLVPAILGAAVVVALGLWQPWKKAAPMPTPLSAAAEKSASLTEAQQLVEKARRLLAEGDEMDRGSYTLAEEALKKAELLDVTDASVWALHFDVSFALWRYGFDTSAVRREGIYLEADRVAKLAPNSLAAELSAAQLQTAARRDLASVEQRLQALVEKYPRDARITQAQGQCLFAGGKTDQALEAVNRALQLAPDDPRLKADRVNMLILSGRFNEAESALAQALQGRTGARLWAFDVLLKLTWRGDLNGAVAAVQNWPAWFLLEDRGCSLAGLAYLWCRASDQALTAVNRFPRDYIRDTFFSGPREVLTALAHEEAREIEAARADWRTVLQVTNRELAASPNNVGALHWKAWALARLGDTAAAEQILRALEEKNVRFTDSYDLMLGNLTALALAVGQPEQALARLTRLQNRELPAGSGTAPGMRVVTKAILRSNPMFDPLRGDPRFQTLIAAAPAPEENTAASLAAPAVNVPSAAPDKSVAVLAFADLSAARDSEYFSDGISDELINVLGRVPGLVVKGRSSSFYFKGKGATAQEKGQKLGVTYLVDGSVRRAGDTVRITAQLIRAATDEVVWSSEPLNRDVKDVFAVQEEIAGLIAKNLSLKLGASSAASTAPVNPQAFELYVQARQAWNRRSKEGYDQAEALFTRAIELDSNFARAYVGLADVLDLRAWDEGSIGRWDQRHSEVFKKIHALLDRAIALDSNLAEAYASLGAVIYDEWNYREALTAARRAVQLNPNYATGWYWLGEMLWDRGDADEGMSAVRQAVELDPLSLAAVSGYSQGLRDTGRPTEALVYAERALKLQPDSPRALGAKALALLDLDQIAAAVPLVRELLKTEQGRAHWTTSVTVVRAGMTQEAEELLAQYRRSGADWQAAPLLALLGRREEFFAVWQKRPMMTNQPWYIWTPQIDGLRNDPRFLQVLDQVGLTEAHARAQAWRAAHPPEKVTAKK